MARNIISNSNTNVEQMKAWAIKKRANQLFVDLAPTYYNVAVRTGIDPAVLYAQSAKETGYMKFGGVLDASFKNPCGLKITAGGDCKDPNAHKRFSTWDEGIQAQADHLALYAGQFGYPKSDSPDPRHFPYLRGSAKTVESLGGKWAPSKQYGTDLLNMVNELESTTYTKNNREKAWDQAVNKKLLSGNPNDPVTKGDIAVLIQLIQNM